MMSRFAIALCLLVALGGASLASGPGSEAAPGAAATNETADPSAASSDGGDQATGDAAGEAESADKKPPPIDVHRHRPGACPEGPPCKGDGD
jgi:hypothetical protein